MRVTLASLLDATLPTAPPELFPPSAIEPLRIDRSTWTDPPAVGFECRLAPGSHPIDLGLLARPNAALPGCVDAVFFEWDQLPSRTLRDAPLLFYRFGHGISVPEASAAVAEFAGRQLGELTTLPPDARVTDFGRLDARAAGWARVGLLLGFDTARELLARASWEHAGKDMHTILGELESADERVRVQVDLDPLRFVGIEIVADQTPRGEGWAALFELLMSHGLCDAGRVAAVQRWPANIPARVEGVGWCAIRRTISHLKLSQDHSGRLHAKAYLFATLAELW